MIDFAAFLEYALWGLVGAVAHLLIMKFSWQDRVYPVREIGMAVVVAFVVSQLGLPNKLTTFGLAFIGVDAMESFLRRLMRES